jgi:hypothetical protein
MSEENMAESNITKFFEKYGTEGFLRLYFTNYLFELVMHFLRTEDPDDIRYDSSYHYHFLKDAVVTPEKEEEFRKNIRKECAKKADEIVKYLRKRKLVDKIAVGFYKDSVAKMVQISLKDILTKFSKTQKEER